MNSLDDIFRELGFPDEVPPPPPVHRERPGKGPCGKTEWPSEHQAKHAMRTMLRRKSTDTTFLRTYKCPTCHTWHITSQRPYEP